MGDLDMGLALLIQNGIETILQLFLMLESYYHKYQIHKKQTTAFPFPISTRIDSLINCVVQ